MPDFPYGKDYPEEDFFDQDGIVPSSWSADRYGVDGAEAELDRRPEDDDDLSEECSGQLRMAHRLAVGYRDRLMYVEGIGWHHWDGKRWAFDDGGYAKRAVIYILEQAIAETIGATKDSPLAALRRDVRKCESAFGVTGILALAAALEPFATTVRDLDPDPYLLNCANGTLDLRTMQLDDHNPADLITKVTRGAYHADADSQLWTAFLKKVLPDSDVRDYLRRVTGVALLGSVIEHNLIFATGNGRNGKGTFYETVLFALGDYADMAAPELFMDNRRTSSSAPATAEMALRGLRLAVLTESGRGRRLDEAKMKRLTGGDPITARNLYQHQITFEPSHLPLMVTNHLPRVSDDGEAVWERLRSSRSTCSSLNANATSI